jgi:aminopeptidase N
MIDTDEYSNAQTSAACLDLGRVFEPSVLEPFADRYFADAQKIWDTKTFKMSEYLLERLYPMNLASHDLAQKTRDYLESNPQLDRSMRRMLVENLSSLERALAAQVLDK